MAMFTTDHPELLDTPLRKIFFQMPLPKAEYSRWINMMTTRRNFEDELRMAEFGELGPHVEGDTIVFDDVQELETKRFTPITFTGGYIVTEKLREDDQHGKIVTLTKSLRKSVRYLYEVESYKILNNMTSTALERYVGFDDLALASTAHVDGDGGTQSNRPTTAVVISNTAVEAAQNAFYGWKDQRGVMPIQSTPRIAIGHYSYQHTMARIFQNAMRYDTADWDENWVRKGPADNGVSEFIPSRYITNTKYWALLSGKDGHDLKLYNRVDPQFKTNVDFQTGNYQVKVRCRFQTGFSDWRGGYYSPAT